MLEKASPASGGTISLDTAAADALIRLGDGNAALLYIQILKSGGIFDPEAAERELSLSHEGLNLAAAALRRKGLISPCMPDGSDGERPEYTIADVKARLEAEPDFQGIVQEVQRRLSRPLSGPDLKILFGIYDTLGMPFEVILLLFTHCIEEYQRRNGEGRFPTMKYIERVAYDWARRELLTPERAEEYLRLRREGLTRAAEVKKALGINDRKPSVSEENLISSWLDNGFDIDAITLAYDKTVLNTGALKWRYMNSILESWHSKNLHSLSEIVEKDTRSARAEEKKSRSVAPSCEDSDRLLRYLGQNMD